MGKKLNSVSKWVTHAVGGDDFADYAGAKYAKMKAKGDARRFVEDKTSAKKALVSAANVAAYVVPMSFAHSVAAKVGVRAAAKAAPKVVRKVAKKAAPKDKYIKIPTQKKPIKINLKPQRGETINKGDEWSDW